MISIVIPCKDRASIIPECLRSIGEQSYPEIEVIVEEGLSVNENRNRGWKRARGEYILFLDNDITLRQYALQDMHTALQYDSSASFAYGHYIRKGALTGMQHAKEWNVQALKNLNYISTMSLFRKSDFPGFDESLPRMHDWDVYLTLAEQGKHGIFLDKVMFEALYKPGDISTKNNYAEAVEIVRKKHGI